MSALDTPEQKSEPPALPKKSPPRIGSYAKAINLMIASDDAEESWKWSGETEPQDFAAELRAAGVRS